MYTSNANASSAMDVLLEPQIQLVSRIEYLINTENRFCFLHGESGVGKTFIANLLVEKQINIRFIKLNCKRELTSEELKQQFVIELATDSFIEDNNSLSGIALQAIDCYQQSMVVVVDNAQRLSAASIQHLWQCFNEVTKNNKLNISFSLLFIGSSTWAKPLVAEYSKKKSELITEFELPYLTTEQAVDFLRLIYPDWPELKIVQHIGSLQSISLTPKALIYGADKSSINKRRNVFFILCFAVLLSLGGMAGWLLHLYPADQNVTSTERLIQKAPEDTYPELLQSKPNPVEKKQTMPLPSSSVGEDKVKLSKSILEEADVLNVADTTPDKLVTIQTEEVETDSGDNSKAFNNISEYATLNPLPIETSVPKSVKLVKRSYDFDEHIILAIAPENFALMLGGFGQQQILKQVKSKIKDQADIYVYKTIRNGEDWFVLLYGDFTSRVEANSLMAALPAHLSQFIPWVKPYHSIQSEIAAVATKTENNN